MARPRAPKLGAVLREEEDTRMAATMWAAQEPGTAVARRRSGRTARVAGNLLFTASLLVAAALIGGPQAARMLDLGVMVVTTGSMRPGIQPGDVVVLEPVAPDAIRLGDVITFQGRDAAHLTTHRVLKVEEIKGDTWFQTKGDANEEPDVDLAAAAAMQGRVRSVIPRLGPWLLMAQSRWGPVVLLGIPASILALQEAAAALLRRRRRRVRESPRWTSVPA